MKNRILALAVVSVIAPLATATTIDFSALAEGATVSNQFPGVTFTAGGLTGSASDFTELPSSNTSIANTYATNTDMVVTADPLKEPAGVPPFLKVLHTAPGWAVEDGTPIFTLDFATPITSVSVYFYGDAVTSNGHGASGFFAYNGATRLTLARSAAGDPTATNTPKIVTFSAPSITRLYVMPGDYSNLVSIGRIDYTSQAVPEPVSLTLLGLGGLALLRRRRASN